jgi:DNA-binding transcriptional LysR family regulator
MPRDQPPAAMQLPYLETFAKAAELSSFTATARALRLTQAAVSQRVQALEKELGVSLFRRRGGRVSLTDAGQKLYAYAERILRLHREAREQITGQTAPVAGELSVAASSIPGEHLLPEYLAIYRERYPHVRVRVMVADTHAVLRSVERGEAQLGLVGAKGHHPDLEFQPFATDEMVLVATSEHRVGTRQRITVAQLSKLPLILREPGSGSRECFEEALHRAGQSLADMKIALELGSNEAIKEAIHRGMGAAILSRHAVKKELQTCQLQAIRIDGLNLERDLYAVFDRRRALAIPARLLLDLLHAKPTAIAHP